MSEKRRPSPGRWLDPLWARAVLFVTIFGTAVAVPRATGRAVDNAWEMPPIILPDIEGVERNLHEWAGQVILLNFWATWCGPCRIEIPKLIEWQARFGDRGLQVVSVGIDDVRKLRNYARSMGINYPVLPVETTAGARLLRRWGDRAGVLPFTVVIGPDGHLVFMREGMFDEEAFDTYVLPLLMPTSEGTAEHPAPPRGLPREAH